MSTTAKADIDVPCPVTPSRKIQQPLRQLLLRAVLVIKIFSVYGSEAQRPPHGTSTPLRSFKLYIHMGGCQK